MNKIAALEAQVIAETERKLSAEDVERIADLIHRADYVDFFARDANAATATYASHNFTLTGKISSIYQNMGIESVVIDADTNLRDFQRDLRLGEVFYH